MIRTILTVTATIAAVIAFTYARTLHLGDPSTLAVSGYIGLAYNVLCIAIPPICVATHYHMKGE